MKSIKTTILGFLCFLVSVNASALTFKCRSEDPHIITDLSYDRKSSQLKGEVIVGFVHGMIVCPMNRSRHILCSGQYRFGNHMELFHAELEIRGNQMGQLNLQLPSTENQPEILVTCIQY